MPAGPSDASSDARLTLSHGKGDASKPPSKDALADTGHVVPPPVEAGGHVPPHLGVPDAGADVSASIDAGFDASVPADATYPAFSFEVPQVSDDGAAVVGSALFVPVVFPGETLGAKIEAFMSAIGASDYWSSIGTEYGVGPATTTSLVVESTSPGSNITDAEIQQFLASAISTDPRYRALGPDVDAGSQAANPSAMPPPDVIYVLFYPAGTSISADTLGESCAGFGGYHSSFMLSNGGTVAYAVIPRCATFNDLSGIDFVTVATSHELIEAATDPNPTVPSYAGVDTDHFVWQLTLGNGEVADMCSFLLDANVHPTEPAMSAFLVQRVWSNAAALAGNDPCVPVIAGEGAYFNTVPESTEVDFVDQGKTYQTLGTQIPVGHTATVTLDLASDAPTSGPWTVQLLDYGVAYQNPAYLDLKIVGAAEGLNGLTLTVQITALQAGPTSLLGISPYFIYSTIGEVSTFWIGAVTN